MGCNKLSLLTQVGSSSLGQLKTLCKSAEHHVVVRGIGQAVLPVNKPILNSKFETFQNLNFCQATAMISSISCGFWAISGNRASMDFPNVVTWSTVTREKKNPQLKTKNMPVVFACFLLKSCLFVSCNLKHVSCPHIGTLHITAHHSIDSYRLSTHQVWDVLNFDNWAQGPGRRRSAERGRTKTEVCVEQTLDGSQACWTCCLFDLVLNWNLNSYPALATPYTSTKPVPGKKLLRCNSALKWRILKANAKAVGRAHL